MYKRVTTEEFIEKVKLIHGEDKYDYSETVYINYRTKVKIFCNSCQKFFEQRPDSHYVGGCKDCGRINQIKNRSLGKDEFIKRANEKHQGKYDYSLVEYVNSSTYVNIICPKHGIFFQSARNHLQWSVCPYCPSKAKSNTEKFIENAILKHGNRYSYENVIYTTADKKVDIICKVHGIFSMRANTHLNGSGCRICGNELRQNGLNKYKHSQWKTYGENSKKFESYKVYIIKCWNDYENFYKIGKTFKTIHQRFSNKTAMPYKYEVLKLFEGESKVMSELEDELHRKNKLYKYVPNISFGGMTECFSELI